MAFFLGVLEMHVETFGMMISQHWIRMELAEFVGDVSLPGLVSSR
jgi:hypothetical protein